MTEIRAKISINKISLFKKNATDNQIKASKNKK